MLAVYFHHLSKGEICQLSGKRFFRKNLNVKMGITAVGVMTEILPHRFSQLFSIASKVKSCTNLWAETNFPEVFLVRVKLWKNISIINISITDHSSGDSNLSDGITSSDSNSHRVWNLSANLEKVMRVWGHLAPAQLFRHSSRPKPDALRPPSH